MSRFSYRPGPPLADFVERFWLHDAYGGGHARERVLPTGTMELVVNLRGDRWGPLICGPHSESFVIGTADRPSIMGVHFKPGGAFPFFESPAGELHNARVPLDAVWGRCAAELQERLLETETPRDG
jgi:hypothetical protein